jgi:phytoene dehydrogenase-like protein
MSRKVIIIGSGIAGLSAGILLKRMGFDTEIFELAPWAGGMCAAWFRNGYRFECMGWLDGTNNGDPLFLLLKELGALEDNAEIYHAGAVHIEVDGTVYEVPMDVRAFGAFLRALTPQDTHTADEFCRDIEVMMRVSAIQGLPKRCQRLAERLRSDSCYRAISHKYTGKTVREISSRFKNPTVGKLMTRLVPGEYSALPLFSALSARMAGNAGYPFGGAAGIVGGMLTKYLSLGGKINFNAKADEIVVTGGTASGIRSCGVFIPSDGVVAACDTHETMTDLLGNRYGHPPAEAQLKKIPLFEPLIVISFGLDRKFGIPFSLTCECPEGFTVAPGVKRYGYALRSFDFDPSAAPPGGSSVMAMFEAPLDYWKKLRQDNPRSYRLQKEVLADLVASLIEKRYPGFKDAVCVVDIATPATFSRLTNVYRGSFEGIAPTPEALGARIRKTVPGLRRFCVCGQWTTPGGGIGAAAADGRLAAHIMRKELR